jgi:hypothetical protein
MLRRRVIRAGLGLLLAVLVGANGCGDGRDVAEVHRRLSLRLEHHPPGRTLADKDAEIRARAQSSLEAPQLTAWVRIVEADDETRIPLRFVSSGDAVGRIPARHRGEVVRYVIEAKDAAGLVVTLPKDAREGKSYTLRFEGRSSPLLGATSLICAWLATLLFLGAGAAAVQALRGRLSVGPAGLLAGLAATLVLFGVLLVGGIHAFQITGKPWPSSPLILAMSRGDLALLALLWAGNLALGRRALMDEEPDGTRFDERIFATAGAAAGVLCLVFLLF